MAANLGLLTLADAAYRGYSAQKDANRATAKSDAATAAANTQQQFDNSIKTKTLQQQHDEFQQQQKAKQAADLRNQQAPIVAKLQQFAPGDPAAAPYLNAYQGLEAQIAALNGENSSSQRSAPFTPATPRQSTLSTPTGMMGGQELPTFHGLDSAAGNAPSIPAGVDAGNPYAMTPLELAATRQATETGAATLEGLKAKNTGIEQTTRLANAAASGPQTFYAAAAALPHSTPAQQQNARAFVSQWNKTYGTSYSIPGEKTPAGNTQPWYDQDLSTAAALGKTKADTNYIAANTAHTSAETQQVAPLALSTIARNKAESSAVLQNAATNAQEAKTNAFKALIASQKLPANVKIDGFTPNQVLSEMERLDRRQTYLMTPNKQYPMTTNLNKAHPDWEKPGKGVYVTPVSGSPVAASEYQKNQERITRLQGIADKFMGAGPAVVTPPPGFQGFQNVNGAKAPAAQGKLSTGASYSIQY